MNGTTCTLAVILVTTFSSDIHAQYKSIDDCRAYALAIEKVVIARDNLKSPSLEVLKQENPILGNLGDPRSKWRATQAWMLYDGIQFKTLPAARLKTMMFEHCEKEYFYYFPNEESKEK